MHKSIPFECTDKETDEEGRYICVYCKIYRAQYVIIALYIPPPYNCVVFKIALAFLSKYPGVPGVIIGVYNTIVDSRWDRVQTDTMSPGQTVTPFGRMLEEISLYIPDTPAPIKPSLD